jgi:hypothetical protein
MNPIATLEFETELVREYSAVPAVESLGRRRQRMPLYLQDEGHGLIEWEAGEDGEGAVIGLFFEGRRVVDYDGVFELPVQAVELLEAAGYDPAEASS